MNLLQFLICFQCTSLERLQQQPNIIKLVCYGCNRLQILPSLPAIEELYCGGCSLLLEWNDSGENLEEFGCGNCPLLHLRLKLHLRCNKLDGFGNFLGYLEVRRRNGIACFIKTSFFNAKFDYVDSLNSRIASIVSRNHELYRPGGSEYLKLVSKYSQLSVLNN